MFCHIWQKFENSKWPPFLGRGKFCKNYQEYNASDTLWVENIDEIALSRTVKEIEGNLCFAIFGKNSKIQNGRHFWEFSNFCRRNRSMAKHKISFYLLNRAEIERFRRNRSISHG